ATRYSARAGDRNAADFMPFTLAAAGERAADLGHVRTAAQIDVPSAEPVWQTEKPMSCGLLIIGRRAG
nr:hypothetical protein [Actinomycetales bacterium]